jgi:hypothetical protein
MDNLDKRQSERVTVYYLGSVRQEEAAGAFCVIEDVSIHGLRLVTPSDLEIGLPATLEIRSNPEEGPAADLKKEIIKSTFCDKVEIGAQALPVWKEKTSDQHYRVGMRFQKIGQEDRQRLLAKVGSFSGIKLPFGNN